MDLPFTPDQFFDVFRQYNLAVWPMQAIIYLLAFAALFLAIKPTKYSDTGISIILAFLWLWIGIIYHLIYFTTISKAAYIFGGLFIIQAVLFLITGSIRQKISFSFHMNLYTIVGSVFILYGMLIYPALGYFLGHQYPYSPTFGLPCPTTIFTFGLLLWTDSKFPKYLLVIPLLWSILGFFAAVQLGVLEDIMLPITGMVATAMILYRDKQVDKRLAERDAQMRMAQGSKI
jgi:hypothetical protein